MFRFLNWKWSMRLGFVLTLVAYHAGALYFGMPWKLFLLGLIASAWVFSTVVVAFLFDGLSPPHQGTLEGRAKLIGVGRAILVGEIVVNIPALGLFSLTTWQAGPIIQGWIEGGARESIGVLTLLVVMTLALGIGWMW